MLFVITTDYFGFDRLLLVSTVLLQQVWFSHCYRDKREISAGKDAEATRIWQLIRGEEDCYADNGAPLLDPDYCIEPACDYSGRNEFCSIKNADTQEKTCIKFPDRCKELATFDLLSNCCALASSGECSKNWVKIKCQRTCGTRGATEDNAASVQPNPDTSRCPKHQKDDFMNAFFGERPPEDSFA